MSMPGRFDQVWSHPARVTEDYPNLVVHDGRVTGSITAGHSRLPLWCLIYVALTEGWPAVESNWHPNQYELTAASLAMFLYDLLEQRGEFGRLLCMLADAERRERSRDIHIPWWQVASQRRRIRRQLVRCTAALDAIDAAELTSSP